MWEDFALCVIWCLMVFPKNDNEMRRVQSEIRYCQNYIWMYMERMNLLKQKIESLRLQYADLKQKRELKYKKNSFRD